MDLDNLENKNEIQKAYKAALSKYAHRENITGIDIGYKYIKGKSTDDVVIRIHVKEKKTESNLEGYQIIPSEIEGIKTDIIQANYELHNVRKKRLQPIQPGISIGHYEGNTGTLGAVVYDKNTGKPGILSNWHVLVGNTKAKPGDSILQPGNSDGGKYPNDVVANLEKMILGVDGDAAFALLNKKRFFRTDQFGSKQLITSDSYPKIGDILEKSGRTTGITQAKVDGFGRYFLDYSVGRKGIDGFKLVTKKSGNPDNEEISSEGDSGSLWYNPNTKEGAGLHFAGEKNTNPKEEHALACYLTNLLLALDISLSSDKVSQQTNNNPNFIQSQFSLMVSEWVEKHKLKLVELSTLLKIDDLKELAFENKILENSNNNNTQNSIINKNINIFESKDKTIKVDVKLNQDFKGGEINLSIQL